MWTKSALSGHQSTRAASTKKNPMTSHDVARAKRSKAIPEVPYSSVTMLLPKIVWTASGSPRAPLREHDAGDDKAGGNEVEELEPLAEDQHGAGGTEQWDQVDEQARPVGA